MAFDIKKYRDDNRAFYGDASLEDVAKDAYDRFGVASQFPSYDDWKKQVHIQPIIEEDTYQRQAQEASENTPGLLGELGRSVGRGFTQTALQEVGKGLQWLDPDGGIDIVEKIGKSIEDFGNQNVRRFPGLTMSKAAAEASNWNPRKWVANAGESLVQSAAPLVAGAAGTLAGGPAVGAAAGLATLGTMFYGGTAEDTFRRAKEKGLSDDDAMQLANINGSVEAGGELIADMIPIHIFGALGKGAKGSIIKSMVSRKPVKEMMKDVLNTIVGEELTESGQQAIQQYAENKYGTSDMDVMDSVAEVWGPTLVTSLIFGAGGIGYNNVHISNVRNALTNPNIDPDTRLKAIQEVAQAAHEIDPAVAKGFYDKAIDLWKQAKPIVLDDDEFYMPQKSQPGSPQTTTPSNNVQGSGMATQNAGATTLISAAKAALGVPAGLTAKDLLLGGEQWQPAGPIRTAPSDSSQADQLRAGMQMDDESSVNRASQLSPRDEQRLKEARDWNAEIMEIASRNADLAESMRSNMIDGRTRADVAAEILINENRQKQLQQQLEQQRKFDEVARSLGDYTPTQARIEDDEFKQWQRKAANADYSNAAPVSTESPSSALQRSRAQEDEDFKAWQRRSEQPIAPTWEPQPLGRRSSKDTGEANVVRQQELIAEEMQKIKDRSTLLSEALKSKLIDGKRRTDVAAELLVNQNRQKELQAMLESEQAKMEKAESIPNRGGPRSLGTPPVTQQQAQEGGIESNTISTQAPNAGNGQFNDYRSAIDWIDSKSKEYGGKNKFMASDEYKAAYPEIKRLHDEKKAEHDQGQKLKSADAIAAMEESGVKVGDVVEYDAAGPGMTVETYRGKIAIGVGKRPIVKLEQPTSDGRNTALWHKGWRKQESEVIHNAEKGKTEAETLLTNQPPNDSGTSAPVVGGSRGAQNVNDLTGKTTEGVSGGKAFETKTDRHDESRVIKEMNDYLNSNVDHGAVEKITKLPLDHGEGIGSYKGKTVYPIKGKLYYVENDEVGGNDFGPGTIIRQRLVEVRPENVDPPSMYLTGRELRTIQGAPVPTARTIETATYQDRSRFYNDLVEAGYAEKIETKPTPEDTTSAEDTNDLGDGSWWTGPNAIYTPEGRRKLAKEAGLKESTANVVWNALSDDAKQRLSKVHSKRQAEGETGSAESRTGENGEAITIKDEVESMSMALTEGEGRYLLSWTNVDAIRAAIAEGRSQGIGKNNDGPIQRPGVTPTSDIQFSVSNTLDVSEPYIEWKKNKPDLNQADLLLSQPLYAFKKVPALKQAFEAASDYIDLKFNNQRELLYSRDGKVAYPKELERFKNGNKEEYNKAFTQWLVGHDEDQIGYKVKQIAGEGETSGEAKFQLVGPDGLKWKEGIFDTEAEAWEKAIEYETEEYLKEKGATEAGAVALRQIRTIGHNMFNMLYADLKAVIEEYEEAGEKLPKIAQYDKSGKRIEISLKQALIQMGDLRGSYFPRNRQPGKYVLIAKKEGANPIREHFDLGIEYKSSQDWRSKIPLPINRRARELKNDGYTVTLDRADNLPESIFVELSGKTVALENLVAKALEKVTGKSAQALSELGISSRWKGDDYILSGDISKGHAKVLQKIGGEYRHVETKNGGYNEVVFKNAQKGAIEQEAENAILEFEHVQVGADLIFAESIINQISDMFKSRGARSKMIGRNQAIGQDVWKGYEEDPITAFTSSATGISGANAKGQLARNLHNIITGKTESWAEYKFRYEMENMGEKASYRKYLDEVNERKIDPAKQKNAYNTIMSYSKELLRNDEQIDRIIGTMKGLAVLKYLAGRVSSPLVNLTALATSVPANMNGRVGIPLISIPRLLSKAMLSYKDFKFGKGDSLDEWTLKALETIESKGWDSPQNNNEAFEVLKNKLSRKYDKFIEFAMMGFSVTEKINRAATILATYQGIKEQHKGAWNAIAHGEALEKAKEVSDKAHGVYGKINMPHWARGGGIAGNIAKSFYVFRTFSHNYMLSLAELGMEKQWKALTYMLLSPAVLAGTGASVATPLIAAMLRAMGYDDDPEEKFYRWIEDMMGQVASQFARSGIAGMGGYGPALKGSLQIGILDLPTSIADLMGAPGSIVQDIYHGVQNLMKGNEMKAAEQILPIMFASPIRAIRESTEGITSRTNSPVFYGREQLKLNPFEAGLRMLSFNPARIAAIRDRQRADERTEQRFRDNASEIYAKAKKVFLMPIDKRSESDFEDILIRMNQYNSAVTANPEYSYIPKMSWQTIMNHVRQSMKPTIRERTRELREAA